MCCEPDYLHGQCDWFNKKSIKMGEQVIGCGLESGLFALSRQQEMIGDGYLQNLGTCKMSFL